MLIWTIPTLIRIYQCVTGKAAHLELRLLIRYRINCFISYVPNISYSLIYHTLPIGSKPLQGLYIRLYASSGG
jgi:hypothetical protein